MEFKQPGSVMMKNDEISKMKKYGITYEQINIINVKSLNVPSTMQGIAQSSPYANFALSGEERTLLPQGVKYES